MGGEQVEGGPSWEAVVRALIMAQPGPVFLYHNVAEGEWTVWEITQNGLVQTTSEEADRRMAEWEASQNITVDGKKVTRTA